MSQMSRLLDEALPLGPHERHSWLEALPDEQRHLADALRAALLPQAGARPDADSLPRLEALPGAGSPGGSGFEAGARVGPYELIRSLGTGGMAEVWLARRADGAFRREVALKLPILTRLRADLAQRFARECDILAGLEHPHIARLYDAGVDAGGTPYLAMEYVRGQSLIDWCEARGLAAPARLRLMLQVLEAVQYAHEHQVIHRDLKPSNILVTDAGEARLLDFGIARLLRGGSTDEVPLTGLYGRALTPDYASPELLRGGRLDERSDLYTLGILLHELLTGVRPELPGAAPVAGGGVRTLRGDLEAIARKALAADPADRYPSAAEFAADLKRYLAGEPVAAQPPRVGYRLGKFARRHRAPLIAAAAAVMVALAAYTLRHEVVVRAASTSAASPAPIPSAAAAAAPVNSVAVLPFVDMSENRDQAYLSDGLSEQMIDLLTKVPGLEVIARTSSFSFRDKADDVPTIARKLRVANILEGSVRKSGNRLRVTTQLVQAATGVDLWSETYDREIKDVFKVQDDVASAVVAALKVRLLSSRPIAGHHLTDNAEAYQQFLLGRQLSENGTPDGRNDAVGAFGRAVELDPHFAASWAALAKARFWAADLAGDRVLQDRAMMAAEKAVALAPDEVEGYVARGFLRQTARWDWDGAQADYDRAEAIDPGNSEVRRMHEGLARTLGRFSEAIALGRRDVEQDPVAAGAWGDLAASLCADREFAAAHEAYDKSVRLSGDPRSSHFYTEQVALEVVEGRSADALGTARSIAPGIWRLFALALAEHTAGHDRESQRALDQMMAHYSGTLAFQIAEVYAWRGEREQAFAWLERAYQQHDNGLTFLKSEPLLNGLHTDPRFVALLKKMNLPV
jgi:serine/threonine-protein kinase